jgi:CBS-domain-containing membrane protein
VRNTPAGPAVTAAMIRFPKVCGTGTTVGQARDHLLDDHVHALLIVVDGGVLVAVVERTDLAGAQAHDPAWPLGRLTGRVVGAGADLAAVTGQMAAQDRRRVAVVDDRGHLVGLLCRKRSGQGFCSDAGVEARAAARDPQASARSSRAPSRCSA